MSRYYMVRLTAKEIDTIRGALGHLEVSFEDWGTATHEERETLKAIDRLRGKLWQATGE
jgi:uncharacterized coiled-coil DUF342 family protein